MYTTTHYIQDMHYTLVLQNAFFFCVGVSNGRSLAWPLLSLPSSSLAMEVDDFLSVETKTVNLINQTVTHNTALLCLI